MRRGAERTALRVDGVSDRGTRATRLTSTEVLRQAVAASGERCMSSDTSSNWQHEAHCLAASAL